MPCGKRHIGLVTSLANCPTIIADIACEGSLADGQFVTINGDGNICALARFSDTRNIVKAAFVGIASKGFGVSLYIRACKQPRCAVGICDIDRWEAINDGSAGVDRRSGARGRERAQSPCDDERADDHEPGDAGHDHAPDQRSQRALGGVTWHRRRHCAGKHSPEAGRLRRRHRQPRGHPTRPGPRVMRVLVMATLLPAPYCEPRADGQARPRKGFPRGSARQSAQSAQRS